MNTKAFFPCGGGSNLILGTGIENQIFFLRTPATVKFFHQKEEKSLPTQMDFYNLYMVCHTIPQGNYNFERSTNKISFFDEFSTSGKICRFNKGLKI